jgi:hypothetical protein
MKALRTLLKEGMLQMTREIVRCRVPLFTLNNLGVSRE